MHQQQYSKRQSFRIQIRQKQIKNILYKLRKEHENIHIKQSSYSTGNNQIFNNVRSKYIDCVKEALNFIWELKKNGKYQEIVICLANLSTKISQTIKNSNESDAQILKKCFSEAINQLLRQHFDKIMQLCSESTTEQQCFGKDLDECFNTNQIQTSQQIIQNKISLLQMLNIVRICSQIFSFASHEDLSIHSCIIFCKLLLNTLQQSDNIISTNPDNQQQYRMQYLQILCCVLNFIKSLLAPKTLSTFCIEILNQLGMQSKLRNIVQVSMGYDTIFKHHLADNIINSMIVNFHLHITSVIVDLSSEKVEKEDMKFCTIAEQLQKKCNKQIKQQNFSQDMRLNNYEYFLAYGIYLIKSLSLVVQNVNSESHQKRLYVQALQLLTSSIKKSQDFPTKIPIKTIKEIIISYNINNQNRNYKKAHLKFIEALCEQHITNVPFLVQNLLIMQKIQKELQILYEKYRFQTDFDPDRNLQTLVIIIKKILKTRFKSTKIKLYTRSQTWQKIFSYLHNSSFICLFSVFPEYFVQFGRKVTLKDINILLQNAQNFVSKNNHIYNNKTQIVCDVLWQVADNCNLYFQQDQMDIIRSRYQQYELEDFLLKS